MIVRAAVVLGLALASHAATASCGIPGTGTVVRDVEVVDRDSGRVVHRGEVDLAPTLRRIEAGERAPVGRDDGTAFCRVFYTCDHYKTFVPITPRVSLPAANRAEIEAQSRQSCRR